jgi:hypothetical protein
MRGAMVRGLPSINGQTDASKHVGSLKRTPIEQGRAVAGERAIRYTSARFDRPLRTINTELSA